jgi:hypothetical protein
MDRKGCWHDHVFVERLWRSVQYEEVCSGAVDVGHVQDAARGTTGVSNRERVLNGWTEIVVVR